MTDSAILTLAGQGTPKAFTIIVAMLISGAIGSAIGKSKGRGGAGFALGAFLGLIGWIIVGVMKPANAAPAVAPGTPFCSGCGQPGVWVQTYWHCTRCQRPISTPAPTTAAPPPQGPTCRTCNVPGRWIQESNGWGCDRCRQMIAPAAHPGAQATPPPN